MSLASLPRRAVAAAVLTVMAAAPLPAQQLVRIQNRFRAAEYLHTESGTVQSGPIQQGWWSADWFVESVPGEPQFVRLRNRFRPSDAIHVENGPVTSGPIGDMGRWHSAQWTVDRVSGTSFVRFRNRWRSEVYLHTERGRLEAGPIDQGWWSAQWTILPSPNAATAASSTPLQPVEAQRLMQRLESERTQLTGAMRSMAPGSPRHSAAVARLAVIRDSMELLRPMAIAGGNRDVDDSAMMQLQRLESRRYQLESELRRVGANSPTGVSLSAQLRAVNDSLAMLRGGK